MPLMTVLWIVWGVLTGALILLLIYRSTLSLHEDDQLFLDEAESHMQAEQADLIKRLNKITPVVRVLGAGSGLLILIIGGLWLWQGVMQNRL